MHIISASADESYTVRHRWYSGCCCTLFKANLKPCRFVKWLLIWPFRHWQWFSQTRSYLQRHTLTYGIHFHPLRRGSQGHHHSEVWRGGSLSLSTENTQKDTGLEVEEYQVLRPDNALHQNDQHSRVLCHTTSSVGCTERSTHTGSGPHHRSEAEELLVLQWFITGKIHAHKAYEPLFIDFSFHAADILKWGISENCSKKQRIHGEIRESNAFF